MKKLFATLSLATLVALGFALGTGAAAQAATPGLTDNGNGTATVSWLLPAPDTLSDRFIVPQTLYVTPTCGTQPIQTDVYKYSTDADKATVDALVTKGKLASVNGTPEDSSVYLSNTDTQQTACPPPALIPANWPVGTFTCNTFTLPTPEAYEKYPLMADGINRWTAGTPYPLTGTETVTAHVLASDTTHVQGSHDYTFTASDCPTSTPTPTPTPTSTPPVVTHKIPSGPKLAYTGMNAAEAQALGFGGSGLVLIGLALLVFWPRIRGVFVKEATE